MNGKAKIEISDEGDSEEGDADDGVDEDMDSSSTQTADEEEDEQVRREIPKKRNRDKQQLYKFDGVLRRYFFTSPVKSILGAT